MSDFAKAIELIISTHEGGFQKRPDDPGNWTPAGELKGTKYGISAHSFPDVDIELLTLIQAEDLYRRVWGMFATLEDQRILAKVLDLAVNMQWAGHGPATKILQKAINVCGGDHTACGSDIAVDGVFGPKTAAAANAIDATWLLDVIVREAEKHYQELEAKKPEMSAWFKTWNKRAAWLPALEKETTANG